MDDAVKAWKISILVFGPLREHIGNERIELSVVTKTTVRDVIKQFNLEKWIYENSNDVKDVIRGINLDINFSRIQNLFRFKSRINAQRLWKLYFLAIYLSWFDNR